MRRSNLLLFVLFAGVAIGAAAATALHAQAPSATKPPAFYISEFEVTDPEGIRSYSAQVAATFEPFGGRFIVRGGGTIASLEGDAPNGRIVIIAFDSMEKARAWYDSPAYQAIKPIRHRSAKSRVFVVEGTAN
jgi:uncharacterized protein (DUF1330 family)